MKIVLKTWREVGSIIARRPTVTVPFIVSGFFNALFIYLAYLAPRKPLSAFLAPPIRKFFGERFLHYPMNFVLLPQLTNYTEMIVSVIVGVLMLAVGIGMIADTKRGERATFFINFIRSIKRYFALLGIWLVTFVVAMGLSKLFALFVKPTTGLEGVMITIGFFFASVAANLIFIYALPLLVIKRTSFLRALKESIPVLFRLFIPTVIISFTLSLVYIPVAILESKPFFVINTTFPEMILVVLLVGAAVITFIELLMYASLTVLFLNKEGYQ